MRRYTLHTLGAINIALVLGLVWLWFLPDGSLRNAHWTAPTSHTTDFAAIVPVLPSMATADTSQFIAMLDRPLFSISRRPPPPPPPPLSEAPVDTLSTAKLSGVFQGADVSGVIMNISGKDRRVVLNQTVDGWTLQKIDGRDVTWSSGGQTRVLQLPRAALTTFKGFTDPKFLAGTLPILPPPPLRVPRTVEPNPSTTAVQPSNAEQQTPPRAAFGGRRR